MSTPWSYGTQIFTEQTNLSEIHPALAFVLLVLALIWLSMVEGSQASLVGLPPVNANLFKESHETTYKIMQIINKVRPGDFGVMCFLQQSYTY
jgi:hypothetical protein